MIFKPRCHSQNIFSSCTINYGHIFEHQEEKCTCFPMHVDPVLSNIIYAFIYIPTRVVSTPSSHKWAHSTSSLSARSPTLTSQTLHDPQALARHRRGSVRCPQPRKRSSAPSLDGLDWEGAMECRARAVPSESAQPHRPLEVVLLAPDLGCWSWAAAGDFLPQRCPWKKKQQQTNKQKNTKARVAWKAKQNK